MQAIIVGAGRLGRNLAHRLVQEGHDISIIDPRPAALEEVSGKAIQGVGFDLEILEQAGVKEAQLLVAVAESENVNLVTAQIARLHFHVPRVVARVEDPVKADCYRQQGLDVFCPIKLGLARVEELLGQIPPREAE